ncbi:MAG: VanZ family protein [Promethearchaeota archaeon]|jgi:VanZ family protein
MSGINPKWGYIDFVKVFPAVILGIVIFYFSSLSNPYPTPPSEQVSAFLNPLLHVCEYGLLTFLIFFGFYSKVKPIYLLGSSFFYAFLDEVHQYFVPNRYFDIFDLIIDFVGIMLGFISYLLVKKAYLSFKKKRTDSRA